MAQRSENECQKLCAEIIGSLKEYSTEKMNDPERISSKILQILKTHRPVKMVDHQYGLSRKLYKDHRLIIKEPEDESKVREYMYMKVRKVWLCVNFALERYKCKSSNLQIVNGIVFAPMNHNDNCETKDYTFVMKLQNLLKEGKIKEAHGLICKGTGPRKNTSICSSSSLSNTLLNETSFSAANDHNEISIIDESVSENTTTTVSTISTLSPPVLERFSPTPLELVIVSTRSNVKRKIKNEENDDDCLVIEEPAAKKPKIEEQSKNDKIFEFHHPSTIFLKQTCKKFNISNNAVYQSGFNFWKDIAFHNIPSAQTNIQTHSFKSSNIFACLSLLFTGKTKSCFLIQNVLSEAFREDPVISATKTSEEIEEILINNTASDEQIEFIAKFLECRIGIYYGKTLRKFGKWDQKEEDVVTFILSFDDGYFSVVSDLE